MMSSVKLIFVSLVLSVAFLLAQSGEESSDPCAEQFVQAAEVAVAALEVNGNLAQYQAAIQSAIDAYQTCSGGSGNVVIFYPYLP